jgi:hypothetical protein
MKALLDQDVTVKVDIHNDPVTISSAASKSTATPTAKTGVASGSGSLSGPRRRILNSLSTCKQIGGPSPSNTQVTWLTGYSPSLT